MRVKRSIWMVTIAVISVSFALVGTASAKSHAGHWKPASSPATGDLEDSIASISCPTATECWAAGAGILHSGNGGKSWTRQNAQPFGSVSCPTKLLCWATAGSDGGPGESALGSTTNGGKHWTVTSLSNIGYVEGITCPSSSVCFAPGLQKPSGAPAILETHNGGKSWVTKPAPHIGVLSCLTVKDCFAPTEFGIRRTTNSAKTWKTTSLHHVNPDAVSCVTKRHCVAVGFDPSNSASKVAVTANAGKTWKTHSAAAGPNGLSGVSCPTTKLCWAVGTSQPASGNIRGYIERSPNGGKSWRVQQSYSKKSTSGTTMVSVDCLTSKHCIAGGGPANVGASHNPTFIVYTTNGG